MRASGGGTLSAREVSMHAACSRNFTLEPAFLARVRGHVREGKIEFGGDAIVDFARGVVSASTTQRGRYDHVDLQRGLVDWHTHPAMCKQDYRGQECTIGTPSPSDMANVAIGASKGTMVHLLFSRDGTYVLRLADSHRQRLLQTPHETSAFARRVRTEVTRLYREFEKSEGPDPPLQGAVAARRNYSQFRAALMTLIRQLGFEATLFPGQRQPSFPLRYNCAAELGLAGLAGARAR